MRILLTALIFALALASPFHAEAGRERLAIRDIDGVKRDLLDSRNRATVLFFIAHDCPISNYYAPEMNRIQAAYNPKKIAFYAVYIESDLPAASAKKHAKEYGYRFPALLDPSHALVKKTGVGVTPEAAILSPGGKLLYRGRIDDLYLDLGKRRYEATTHDLRDALDSIVNGRPIAHQATKAVGCFIPR